MSEKSSVLYVVTADCPACAATPAPFVDEDPIVAQIFFEEAKRAVCEGATLTLAKYECSAVIETAKGNADHEAPSMPTIDNEAYHAVTNRIANL